jgi:phage shock protein PspC (stress-responsive transcriptional regulator)
MPLKGFYSFPDFFSFCLQIFIWYLVHCFVIPRYRSSLSLVLIHWFFTKLWSLDLEKNHEFSVLRTFFLVFIWYLVHGFAIPRYRSSMSFVLIHLFFTKLWPLDLEKSMTYQFSAHFFALLTDILLIFDTLLCNTKIQIKFEFGFDPLIFHEVMALGL